MSLLARTVTSRLVGRQSVTKTVGLAATRAYTSHSQLPEEHRMIFEMCRSFADDQLSPNAGEWDLKHEFPKDAVTQLVRIYAKVM